ncbi:KAP family P-loop NTPase fold protein [Clostridium baratii]|uniref:KAP family P-loop NTPase fold protein n=1 Tax=Clostridium baratii TaxID=1561 RepID=UPI001CB11D67|nr:P-loop NTPase fold protein [Clostridium baratii]STB00054.1 Predicted P-loop ATPase [Clostridium baratii]
MSLLFNDIESKEDYLGYKPYIKAFNYIINKGEEYFDTPLVVGIHGKWGSGKSTFMNLLIREIDKNFFGDLPIDNDKSISNQNEYKIIKINSWQFDKKIDFINILFLEIYKSIKNDGDILSLYPELKIKFFEFFKSLEINLNIPLLSEVEKSSISIKRNKNNDSIFKRSKAILMRNNIENIIEHNYFKNKKFIVFIDDLDRCSIDSIVNILEEIKLTLHSMRCVFFLGSDLEYLKSAIAGKYKDIIEYKSQINGIRVEEELSNFCDEYLEKLVQIPFHIPNINIENIKLYLKKIVSNNKESNDRNNVCKIEEDIEEKINNDIKIYNDEIDNIADLFFDLRISPRKAKRIINQAFLHDIFIRFNYDKKDININIVFLILLITIKEIDIKYYNNNFWSKKKTIQTLNEWKKIENGDSIPNYILEFCSKMNDNPRYLDIKDEEIDIYLNVTSSLNINSTFPDYFYIKDSFNLDMSIRDLYKIYNYKEDFWKITEYFFEKIYDKNKFKILIGNSGYIVIYSKVKENDEYLFTLFCGSKIEKSYIKFKYHKLKSEYWKGEDFIELTKQNLNNVKKIISEIGDKI